jgi:hypothetical protein
MERMKSFLNFYKDEVPLGLFDTKPESPLI